MTFNGQIPGPTLRATEGDAIRLTLIVPTDETFAYGIGTNVADIPITASERTLPGESRTICFEANKPGIYRYNSTGVDFIGMEKQVFSGMYGMIIVDPANGYKKLMVTDGTDRIFYSSDVLEFQLQYSQLYLDNDGNFDIGAMLNHDNTHTVVNGMSFGYGPPLGYGPNELCASPNTTELTQLYEIPLPWSEQNSLQYLPQIISVPVDEPVRWFISNHGDEPLIFSIQDEILERVTLQDSVIAQAVDRWTVEPHQGVVVDVLFEEPGTYFAINENGDAEVKGAKSAIVAGDILGCLSSIPSICNPSDSVPPIGNNSVEQKTILHGLYTDERQQEILQLTNVIQPDDLQLSSFCGSDHSNREISGEVNYEITFQHETGKYRIKDNWANISPFSIDEIDASIVYGGASALDMTAIETTEDSGVFEGEFLGRDTLVPTQLEPTSAGLGYSPGGQEMILDSHYFGCASEISTFNTESFQDGDYTAVWGSDTYCTLGCSKVTIYDTNLLEGTSADVVVTIRDMAGNREVLELNAYNPKAGPGYYGTSADLKLNGFVDGDVIEFQYKDVTGIMTRHCQTPGNGGGCTGLVCPPPTGGNCNGLVCLAPLQQTSSGVAPEDVICNQNLELIIKNSVGSPACVTESTAEKLVSRGWGSYP